MQKTNISYLSHTWNPVTGCSAVSEGCKNCWAKVMARRLQAIGSPDYRHGFEPTFHVHRLHEPEKLKKPARIGVAFMGDLFHDDIDFAYISQVYDVMRQCSRHTFFVLTKRAERMENFYRSKLIGANIENVWHGVTIENQAAANLRLPYLARIPGKKWVSAEPMLGEINLFIDIGNGIGDTAIDRLSWIVVGCESGPGRRPCNNTWITWLIDQALEAYVPVFVKQISLEGRVSHDPAQWPEWLRRRDIPEEVKAPGEPGACG